jgi:hypothetical protein
MIAKHVVGDGTSGIYAKPFSSNGPLTCGPVLTGDMDMVSVQLIVDYQVDGVTVANTDAVVASTKVFTFANYTFTGLVGATITIAGATNSGNNGSFVISAVSGDTATCSTASGLVNETFDPTKVTVTVTHTETAAKPAGTWTILASNNYVNPGSVGSTGLGAAQTAGKFTDVTALFGTVNAVTDAGTQYVQALLGARHFEAIFTVSGGKGVATAAVFCKSHSL